MALPRKDVPAAKEDTLVGVLERIIFFNDENFFTIGEVFDEATRENIMMYATEREVG